LGWDAKVAEAGPCYRGPNPVRLVAGIRARCLPHTTRLHRPQDPSTDDPSQQVIYAHATHLSTLQRCAHGTWETPIQHEQLPNAGKNKTIITLNLPTSALVGGSGCVRRRMRGLYVNIEWRMLLSICGFACCTLPQPGFDHMKHETRGEWGKRLCTPSSSFGGENGNRRKWPFQSLSRRFCSV